jgi:hypothetical protein
MFLLNTLSFEKDCDCCVREVLKINVITEYVKF